MSESIVTEHNNRIVEKLMFAKNGDIKNMQIGPFEYEFWDNGLTEKQACEVGEFIRHNEPERVLSPFDFITECLVTNRILFRLNYIRKPIGFVANWRAKRVVKTINENMKDIVLATFEAEHTLEELRISIMNEAKKQGLIKDETN